ncbi:serine hydrolase domain-containing protein [Pseudomarimonas salicorniae]|uniref:Beta-lactamase family protein n=1 Tax=Pseudomarimonas salicorniae TaxID=2933270 RepID=A0ABT0GC99_9GAMM|nr:serine hydrolase domain-containing protein [Lysobacter sp. CAU 1642]MCK7592156.1 beta-lactamase family protein [Lysobacter sp. CAU 1642]
MPDRRLPSVPLDAPRRLRARLVTLALVLISPWAVSAEPVAAPGSSAPKDLAPLVRYADGLAQSVVTRGKVVGMAVAIIHEDRVLLQRGYGVVEAGKSEQVSAETVFRLASLSKAFAGTLAGLLVDEGALRWESRVVDPFPSFALNRAGAAQRVTLRDILSHRMGLPFHTYDRDLEADEPYPLLAAKLAEAPATCDPGDCYGYQNIAFSLVSDLVFAATGDFFTHQVERRIFHPLEMYSSTYGRDALEASESWARPHVRGRRGWVSVRPKENYYRVPPAAGVNASVADMARWMIAHTGGRPDVLHPDLLADLHAPQVKTPNELRRHGWRGARVRDADYATGWRVFDYAGRTLVFHAGAVQGYRAMLGMFPGSRFGIVVLWNCESSAPSGLMPAVLDRYLGLPSRDWTGLEKAPKQRER